jgi:putative flippase GtrA
VTRLAAAASPLRWISARAASGSRFLLVGAAGIVVNQLLLWALVSGLGLHYLLGAVVASQGSTAFNFIGVEGWVFRSRRTSGPLYRFLAFDALNSTSLLLRLPILFVLTSGLHVHYLVSNLVAIAVLTIIRFLVSDGLIWSKQLPEVPLAS